MNPHVQKQLFILVNIKRKALGSNKITSEDAAFFSCQLLNILAGTHGFKYIKSHYTCDVVQLCFLPTTCVKDCQFVEILIITTISIWELYVRSHDSRGENESGHFCDVILNVEQFFIVTWNEVMFSKTQVGMKKFCNHTTRTIRSITVPELSELP